MRRLQQKIGMIYQDFCLVGCATAEENVLNACLPELGPLSVLLGRFPREKRQAARTLLATVGLAGKEDQRADSLSGGEQQRVAVARALMQGGTLLLADEPVASLDPVRAGAQRPHEQPQRGPGPAVLRPHSGPAAGPRHL